MTTQQRAACSGLSEIKRPNKFASGFNSFRHRNSRRIGRVESVKTGRQCLSNFRRRQTIAGQCLQRLGVSGRRTGISDSRKPNVSRGRVPVAEHGPAPGLDSALRQTVSRIGTCCRYTGCGTTSIRMSRDGMLPLRTSPSHAADPRYNPVGRWTCRRIGLQSVTPGWAWQHRPGVFCSPRSFRILRLVDRATAPTL